MTVLAPAARRADVTVVAIPQVSTAKPTRLRDSLCAPLRKRLGLSIRDFARMTSFCERTVTGWESGHPISKPGVQRLTEISRLVDSLEKLVEPSAVASWLQTPNEAFSGLKPLEVIERGETDRLWRMMILLESGTAS